MSLVPKLVVDLGSTCTGSIEDCRESIRQLSTLDIKPTAKFQFCLPGNGNRPLPTEWLRPLVDYGREVGVKVTCSVWEERGLAAVRDAGCTAVKLSWSSDRSLIAPARVMGLTVLVTRQFMERWAPEPGVLNLWTVEGSSGPLYPVTTVQHHQDMLPRYEGFSSHLLTLYANQTAYKAGYQLMEVHGNLVGDTESPDSRFALTLADLTKIGGRVI